MGKSHKGRTLRVAWQERDKSPLGRWDTELASGTHPARGRFQIHWSGANLHFVFVTDGPKPVRYHTIALRDLAEAFYQGLDLRERELPAPIVKQAVIGYCGHEPIRATLRRGPARAGNLTIATRVAGKTVSVRVGCEDGCVFVIPGGSDTPRRFADFNAALAAAKALLASGVESHCEEVDRQAAYDQAVADLFDRTNTRHNGDTK
ncbi:MAG: hypothetical protein OXC13_15870 [Caldilineaceae bacterium]|nr:hypothetical protein [Caldilineaceae bacterium]